MRIVRSFGSFKQADSFTTAIAKGLAITPGSPLRGIASAVTWQRQRAGNPTATTPYRALSRSERGLFAGLHAALNLSRILDPNFMAPEDVGPKDRWHAALAVAARKGEWSWPSELARHKALGNP